MELSGIGSLLVALGVGGIVGALAALATSAGRLKDSFQSFKSRFQSYFVGKTDEPSLALVDSFEQLSESINETSGAFEKLKRAFKRR